MFNTQIWPAVSRKREREDEDEEDIPTSGFGAHRDKRHLSALPFRSSNVKRCTQPQVLSQFQLPHGLQAPSTITPTDSSNENSPIKQDCEDKSFFSPYSSSPTIVQSKESSPMPQVSMSFSTPSSQDTAMYSDHEMTDRDSYNLSPGPYQPDRDFATTIRERIPTPRHTNFFTSSYMENTDSHPRGILARQTVRLPSPISEGEPSPSSQLGSLAYVSMDIEPPSPVIPSSKPADPASSPMIPGVRLPEAPSPSPHKKGHSRSKHSLRDWSGISGAGNGGGKRKFSMGYRNDCDKCRNNVPGHYNHIYME